MYSPKYDKNNIIKSPVTEGKATLRLILFFLGSSVVTGGCMSWMFVGGCWILDTGFLILDAG